MSVCVFALLANITMFISRNKGFEYVRYAGMTELYPLDPSPAFIQRWNQYNERFTASDLDRGRALLQQFTGIDTITGAEARIIAIGAWIHRTFYRRVGGPSVLLSGLTNPLHQYDLLIKDSSQKLWCSQYRSLFGFFCSAAGLYNRYLDAVPADSLYEGFHGLNEVYLPEQKKWVMADITRNILLLKNDSNFLSAADYYQFRVTGKMDTLTGVQGTDSAYKIISSPVAAGATDSYFNRKYMLRYYYTTYLPEVYSVAKKTRRYLLGDPWYENYDPLRSHTNLLFRVRQFFILVLLLGLTGLILLFFSRGSGEKNRL